MSTAITTLAEAPRRGTKIKPFYYRPAAWVDLDTGDWASDSSSGTKRFKDAQVADLVNYFLTFQDIRVIYITGKRPGLTHENMTEWFCRQLNKELVAFRNDYRYDPEYPRLKLTSQEGRIIEVRRAVQWFDEKASPGECWRALRDLRLLLKRAFGAYAEVTETPGLTGAYLWDLGQTREWTPMPSDLRNLFIETSPQGRAQLFRHFSPLLKKGIDGQDEPPDQKLPGLYHYDMRFAYASLHKELADPDSPIIHDNSDEFLPWVAGRYRVRFQAPENSDPRRAFIGIFPVDVELSWLYPPQGETWADSNEVRIALGAGYEVKILERVLFEKRARPLEVWRDRLVTCQERASELCDPADVERVRKALRSIFVATIGRFAKRMRQTKIIIKPGETLEQYGLTNADILTPAKEGPHGWEIEVNEILDKWSQRFTHPEWAAEIWARQRVRLLTGPTADPEIKAGAFHVDPETIIAMQTDGLYLSAPVDWPDDGNIGRFRKKGQITSEIDYPNKWDELYALRDRAEGEL